MVLTTLLVGACAVTTDSADAASTDELSGAFPVGTELLTTADLNLRQRPSRSADVLVVIPRGARVQSAAAAPRAGWYGITYDGTTGWVDGAYLAKPSAAASSGDVCAFSWEERPGYADYTTVNW